MNRLMQYLHSQWDVLSAVTVAAAVFAVALSTYPPPPLIHDAYAYNAAAYRLVHEGVYSYGAGPEDTNVAPNARVTPGQILLLAATYAVVDRSEGFVVAAQNAQPLWSGIQFAFGLLTVLFIGLAGRELGGKRLGSTAGLMAAFYVPFAWASSVALAESTGVMLAAAQLLLALKLASDKTPATLGLALGFGALSGITALVRPALIAWMVVPLVYLAIRRLHDLKRFALLSAAVAIGFSAVWAPWWIRNAVLLEQFVPIRTDVVLVNDEYVSEGHAAPEAVTAEIQLDRAWRALRVPWQPAYDVLWENHYHYDGLRVDFAPFPETLQPSLIANYRIWTAYQTTLLVLALIGLALFTRRSTRLLIAASVPLYVILIHFETQISDRYQFLAMPAMILLAAVAAYGLVMRARRYIGVRVGHADAMRAS